MLRYWNHADTIKALAAARRGVGLKGYLEMVAGIAALAVALGGLERIFG